jgi:hypothetical protein
LSRTVTPRRAYDTYNTRYTHGPTATTRRRGDARIKRCCRQRPGGVEGTHIREKAPKEGVWAMVAAHGRPRAAGRASAPGRRGLEGARRSRRRRRAERRRTGRRRRGRPTRLEDRRHAPARGGAEDGLLEGPVRSRARLVLAGDAVGTGKSCWQEVRRGARVKFGARAPERARRRGRQVDHRTYEEIEQRLNAMGMARAGRGHVREQGGTVPRFTRCGQWRGRGEERACDERLGIK